MDLFWSVQNVLKKKKRRISWKSSLETRSLWQLYSFVDPGMAGKVKISIHGVMGKAWLCLSSEWRTVPALEASLLLSGSRAMVSMWAIVKLSSLTLPIKDIIPVRIMKGLSSVLIVMALTLAAWIWQQGMTILMEKIIAYQCAGGVHTLFLSTASTRTTCSQISSGRDSSKIVSQ